MSTLEETGRRPGDRPASTFNVATNDKTNDVTNEQTNVLADNVTPSRSRRGLTSYPINIQSVLRLSMQVREFRRSGKFLKELNA